MKPARELLKSGRVSEAKYEPPLLTSLRRGYGLAGRWEEAPLRPANQKRARRRESAGNGKGSEWNGIKISEDMDEKEWLV
jgi:hypothetical protein